MSPTVRESSKKMLDGKSGGDFVNRSHVLGARLVDLSRSEKALKVR